jgi:hypothetical protein
MLFKEHFLIAIQKYGHFKPRQHSKYPNCIVWHYLKFMKITLDRNTLSFPDCSKGPLSKHGQFCQKSFSKMSDNCFQGFRGSTALGLQRKAD